MSHPLLGDPTDFFDNLFRWLLAAGIKKGELLELDHICYRVATLHRYEELKQSLADHDTLVDEAEINGRQIAIFKLGSPLFYGRFTITALELPAPSSTPYPEGFEHAEFIVNDLDAFMQTHSGLEFITKDMVKEINPEIALKFPDCSAKFHLRNLLEVVRLQKETGKL